MRRVLTAILLILALPLGAAERWYEAYLRGVNAVNAKQYDVAVDALQKALAAKPTEGMVAISRTQTAPYLPHFWLGIARFHQGDVDAALREWRISEEQGTIAKTDHYATMKGWVAEAQATKLRNARNAAAEPKKNADSAISRALAGQVEALSAGGDRSDAYRAAQRRLQEALGTFNKAGTDPKAFQRAAELAAEATSLFNGAAEEAKKQKAIAASKPKPQPVAPARVLPQPVPQPVVPAPQPVPVAQKPAPQPAAPPIPVESETLVSTRIALQQYRRNLLDAKGKARDKQLAGFIDSSLRSADMWRNALEQKLDDDSLRQIARQIERSEATLAARLVPIEKPDDGRSRIESAYRAYASGDLARAESLLTSAISSKPTAEAHLLRGCTRFTRALLAGENGRQLQAARSDFETALRLNRALRLDERAFSPKLVAYFETIRRQ